MLRLGWFSTGRGKGSLTLMNTIQECILNESLDAKIDFVFSNREFGEDAGSDEFLNQVLDYNIPLVNLSSKNFRKSKGGGPFSQYRLNFDKEVISLLDKYNPDICVMAGYMLIAGPELSNHYRIINIHPAPVGGPTGTWQEVIWTLIKKRELQSGAYIHLVTEELDHGPILSYFTFPIVGDRFDPFWESINKEDMKESKYSDYSSSKLFDLIREQGLIREKPLLLETIRALSKKQITISKDNGINSNGVPGPTCMNETIENLLNA